MRNRIISTLGVVALAFLLSAYHPASYAMAPAPSTTLPATCNADAYVVDKDPSGLNVRESPGVGGKIIGVIPDDTDGTVVHLVSSDSKGWVQIDRAETIEGRVVFDKRGWVSGTMLGISTRGYGTRGVKVYAAAGARKALGTIPPEAEVKVAGCAGDRMQVKYGKLTGWLDPDSQCPNPVTNCN